ncbi:MAG: DUF3999 family protein [Verrucomicrobia bacterium]|jgi:hypothetical protein|nr:DUF3999 family protein [Verrucomicrobiota bacterium]
MRVSPRLAIWCGTLVVSVGLVNGHADDFNAWRYVQEVAVAEPGVCRLILPPETLGVARADLGDVRLLGPQNGVVPYTVERLLPEPARIAAPRSFAVTLAARWTIVLIETGFTQAVDQLTLQTPAASFIKAVAVEGSADGHEWEELARGVPIFRQAGSSQVAIPLPRRRWAAVRLTVDDRQSPPITITGAMIRAAGTDTPTDVVAAELLERTEREGVSRIRVRLPAANLLVASIELASSESLFTREVALKWVQETEYATNEVVLGQGTVYRLAVESGVAASNLTVRLEALAPSRDLLLTIHNQDSPPLPVSAVRVTTRPTELVFRAAVAGGYRLLAGNPEAMPPRYDLSALGERVRTLPAVRLKPGPLVENPDYRAPAALPGVEDAGAPLDVTGWRFRKAVRVTAPGVQRLELDLEVLSEVRPDLADLRLVRGKTQVPYLRDPVVGSHRLAVEGVPADDPKRREFSRWRIPLPFARLPVTELNCMSPTALFQRQMVIFEEIPDHHRGVRQRRELGRADWSRTPANGTNRLTIPLAMTPLSDALMLETFNADNPPIKLEDFAILVRAPRVIFKLNEAAEDLFVYFGSSKAFPPRYDLSLVEAELRAATKHKATLGPIEVLKPERGGRFSPVGTGGPLLWGVLVVVGGSLLALIIRLLPKPPAAEKPPQGPSAPTGSGA